jgi:hypothetical protein
MAARAKRTGDGSGSCPRAAGAESADRGVCTTERPSRSTRTSTSKSESTSTSKSKSKSAGTGKRSRKRSALVDTRVVYCGDNLDQLKTLPDACVDLIYIDPPFNSNRNYEVFWGETKERRSFEDRHGSTQAYIDFMRPRCVELARVLKKTGSFYYHCDWHASHYVKVMLDQIMGENNFVNEVIWKRQSAHSDAKQGSKHLGRVHDTILLYRRGRSHTFHHQYRPYDDGYVEKFYKHVEPETGRRYSLGDITAPGGANPAKGNPFYEFLGVQRYWRFSRQMMQKLYDEGRIVQTRPGAVPRQKRYLDEGMGFPSAPSGTISHPSRGCEVRASATPPRSPSPSSNGSSRPAATKATSCSTRSAAAAPRSSPPNNSAGNGSGSTSRPPPAA